MSFNGSKIEFLFLYILKCLIVFLFFSPKTILISGKNAPLETVIYPFPGDSFSALVSTLASENLVSA